MTNTSAFAGDAIVQCFKKKINRWTCFIILLFAWIWIIVFCSVRTQSSVEPQVESMIDSMIDDNPIILFFTDSEVNSTFVRNDNSLIDGGESTAEDDYLNSILFCSIRTQSSVEPQPDESIVDDHPENIIFTDSEENATFVGNSNDLIGENEGTSEGDHYRAIPSIFTRITEVMITSIIENTPEDCDMDDIWLFMLLFKYFGQWLNNDRTTSCDSYFV